jgi:hypothetical protein
LELKDEGKIEMNPVEMNGTIAIPSLPFTALSRHHARAVERASKVLEIGGAKHSLDLECLHFEGILDVSVTVPAPDGNAEHVMISSWEFKSGKLTVKLQDVLEKQSVLIVRYIAHKAIERGRNQKLPLYLKAETRSNSSEPKKSKGEKYMSNGIACLAPGTFILVR